jgi:dihydroneopterin triphosphate diphosphatase
MARAPFQVLVIPARIDRGALLYALFRRSESTGGYWQWIAGGGEDDEEPIDAAKREAFEEAGIRHTESFVQLTSMAMVPVVNVAGFQWGESVLVIPEHAFGVIMKRSDCVLSDEHTMVEWLELDDAMARLHWDSNRTALWEVDWRLRHGDQRHLVTPLD